MLRVGPEHIDNRSISGNYWKLRLEMIFAVRSPEADAQILTCHIFEGAGCTVAAKRPNDLKALHQHALLVDGSREVLLIFGSPRKCLLQFNVLQIQLW